MSHLKDLTPQAFCDFLRQHGIRRYYFVWDEEQKRLVPSHPALAELAEFIQGDKRDFYRHEGLFGQIAPKSGVLQTATVHRTCRGQAAGGVRFWTYDTVEDVLRDGLRLSRGMTHKNALAGLWWGGGKGVMAHATGKDSNDPAIRRTIYEEYGEFISSLLGCYVTAEDVGTSIDDMCAIFSKTRFTTSIPAEIGGAGNPSVPTALGVVRGMEAALAHLGMGPIEGKKIAVMGLGNVGTAMLGYLRERKVGKIVATDINPGREAELRKMYPGLDLTVRVVDRHDMSILAEPADIVSPCATGAILGPKTIPTIKAPIVCGSANNQLADPNADDLLLAERKLVYVPDFLVNRMGIVACADEQYGYVDNDPAFEAHLGNEWDNSIFNLTRKILADADAKKSTSHRVALDLAEQRSLEPHPITGHRANLIIKTLVARGWAK